MGNIRALWQNTHICTDRISDGAGSRGRRSAAVRSSHGSSRLPKSDENQHVLVGKDPQNEFSAQEISH